MTDLSSIIERLKGAKGADRGLDGLIARDVMGWNPSFDLEGDALREWPDVAGHWHQPGEQCDQRHSWSEETNPDPPTYTSSLDAVVALIEEKLPDGHYSVAKIGKSHIHKRKPDNVRMTHEGYVSNNENIGAPGHQFAVCDGSSAPIALLIAALSAMKERADG